MLAESGLELRPCEAPCSGHNVRYVDGYHIDMILPIELCIVRMHIPHDTDHCYADHNQIQELSAGFDNNTNIFPRGSIMGSHCHTLVA